MAKGLNVFTCIIKGSSPAPMAATVVAYNRDHAAKMLAKALEARGYKLSKDGPIEKVDLETEKVIFLA